MCDIKPDAKKDENGNSTLTLEKIGTKYGCTVPKLHFCDKAHTAAWDAYMAA